MAITVNIHNSDIVDLFVSVNDLNLAGQPATLNNQRFNENQTFSILVQEDGSGTGNITWSVQRTDDPTTVATRTISVTNATTVDVTTQFG